MTYIQNSIIFYVLTFSVLALSGTLLIVIGYYLNALKRFSLYRKDIENIEKDTVTVSENILEKARKQAEDLIISANKRAQEIVEQTKIFERHAQDSSQKVFLDLKEIQKEELKKASVSLLHHYKKMLEKLNEDNINMLKTISKDIETQAISEIEDFKIILRRETLDSQKIVGERIENLYSQAQREIEEYKARELEKVKENIQKMAISALTSAIGRSLSIEDHTDLVLEALAETVKNSKLSSNE